MQQFRNIILSVLFILLSNIELTAQSDSLNYFRFQNQNVKISQIFHEIEKSGYFRLSFNPRKIPLDSSIYIPSLHISFSDLTDALRNAGLQVRERGDHLIIKPSDKAANQVKKPEYFVIKGYIRDSDNMESLIGATIGVQPGASGTISNSYGFYSIKLREGRYTMVISYVGYEKILKKVDLDSNLDINIDLIQNKNEIEEVVIINDETDRALQNLQLGRNEISVKNVRKIPGFMGESDVIKSLQSLPGINFYSDGSTIFHVRGGARDQNLILIDEAPVYNPAHMLGIFSVFSPDALNSIDIYKGDMPAWYGGRLSSVVDIKTREGNSEKFSFSGNTSFVATTLNLEAPLLNKKGSFYLSGRRSHLKWLAGQDNNSLEQLYFTDLNLKTNYRFNQNNRLFFSFYTGIDQFKNREASLRSTGISWTNFAGNIRWNHIFGERLFSNTSLIASNYNYNLYTSYQLSQRWNAGISLIALKSDFSFYINPTSTLYYGLFLGSHSYFPGNYYSGNDEDPMVPGVPDKFSSEKAFYLSHRMDITDRIEVRYGLRFGKWENMGKTTEFVYSEENTVEDTLNYDKNDVYNSFGFFEPRISLAIQLTPSLTSRFSYSRNTQHEFLITNSISPFTSLEVWLPAGPNIEPMISQQLTAGMNFLQPEYPVSFNLELFYKEIWNYISYVDHAYMLFNPHVETQILNGYSNVFGAEFILRKIMGKWNGWISYSWSKARIKIAGINQNSFFPARYDRPHSLSLYSEYKLRPRWDVSASWTFASGSPFSTPTGYYYYLGYQVPYYNKRNNDRLPDYHRLDVSTSLQLNALASKNEHLLKLSIFNLYSRKNPFNINFNKMIDEDGNIVVPSDYSEIPDLESTMMYLFGLVPSISYHFKF
jgi:hypothetical protein